ncbi:MAG: DUF4105 domain-containing protein [Nitrospirae bacterium]|nr:DUF4105 domain-containing protein [Nitrospirota bacterium]
MKSISPFFILLVFLSVPAKGSDLSALDQFIKLSQDKRLWDQRYWQILLHYQPTLAGNKSLIDDPKFFLSLVGENSPEDELRSTLIAFFTSAEKGDLHPRCRFPARYEWLKSVLQWEESLFSNISCHELKKYEKTMSPKSAVLVFPTFFMNNPASMFGHTLLRIDNTSESKLLSFSANYAAYPDSFGFLYPIKGVFGFYKGYFSIFPYYETIRMYNDTEQRDMWEYHLNFSEAEIQMMTWHLWELKEIYSYYYFLDENCSYNLLYLFEAARPTLHLTDRKWYWTIPTDTLRAILSEGVIEDADFRPAKGTKIRYIASLLDNIGQENALKIVEKKLDPTRVPSSTVQEKIKILDLAVEEIQYRYNKHQMPKETYLNLFLSTLNERSKLGVSDKESYKIPVPNPPESGHRSSRISLSEGIRENSSFEEIHYRPAYHTLLDPDEGFVKGLQIVFADTAVRFYNEGKIKLESFDLIDIVSLSPRDRFFKPLSYKVSTGIKQQMMEAGDDLIVYQLNPGVGMTLENSSMGLVYGLVEMNLNVSEEFRDRYALGGGLQFGVIKQINGVWKASLSLEDVSYPFRNIFQEKKVSLVQTIKLNPDQSLNISYFWDQVSDIHRTEGQVHWNIFF